MWHAPHARPLSIWEVLQHLPEADDLPPGAASKHPDGNVEDREDEAELVPLGLRHIACPKVWRRRADAVGGQAAHHVGQLRAHNTPSVTPLLFSLESSAT